MGRIDFRNITKTFYTATALNDVSFTAVEGEFLTLLGPSGCGKTTMLNIIGGLDRYTSGDLSINGVSTKEYKDVDWDVYRNNSIGFVFQSYNLISHQTVFSNVELALTLAGTSREERHKRVVEVLEKVGLGDQLNKKPTQMSGGQMQRVAIARALVNNPEILLADEPTGALDSKTSIQIMELLKEIAKDRLVIMVTHNPTIAEKYSTRIIQLLDGKVIDDTSPYSSKEEAKKRTGKRKKISMSFMTALSLSFKNLLTKKTRTMLTAFAGSIGIIGIALILSLSAGMQAYVDNLERDTLSTYPLELQSQTMNMSGMMSLMMDRNRWDAEPRELDKVYANNIMTNMIQSASTQIQRNDLARFMQYLESEDGRQFHDYTSTIQYRYDVELQLFKPNTADGIVQVNPSDFMSSFGGGGGGGGAPGGFMNFGMGDMNIWSEMLDNQDLLNAQYDVIAGHWPQTFNEAVIVVNGNNEINDMVLYSLGLLDTGEFDELMQRIMRGEEIEEKNEETSFSYEELLTLTFKLLLNTDYYVREDMESLDSQLLDGFVAEHRWVDRRDDDDYMRDLIANALDIRIVGIIRPSENAAATSIDGTIAYTSALLDYVIEAILETDIAKEQLANPEINIFTGFTFDVEGFVESLTIDDINVFIAELPVEEQAQLQAMTADMSDEEILAMLAEQITAMDDRAIYEDNLSVLGVANINNPSAIRLYPKDFNSKNEIERLIAEYNRTHENEGNDEFIINYTDFVGIMTSGISSVINVVSYVLIAFVSISLIVSSIMIAIITYISVLERTKEIGILRSIGASKKDITRVFNAETFIEGFVAGCLGVGITMLLNIPINIVIKSLTDISGLSSLPIYGAIGLVIISVILTVIAGFIPSKMAAKKDPVVALRTE